MATSSDYKVVNLIDVNDLLSFSKREYRDAEEIIKEEKRIQKELMQFIALVQKYSGHKIHYIGNETRFGKILNRFMFKDAGFIEIIVDKPLTIKGHFINKRSAEEFSRGLKKTFESVLPESPIKSMIIGSIKVEDGFKEEMITLDTHNILHKIRIRKTLVMSVVAIQVFLLFELVQEFFVYLAVEYISIPSIIVTIVTAIFIAILFEPLKGMIDEVFNHFFGI